MIKIVDIQIKDLEQKLNDKNKISLKKVLKNGL